MDYKFWQPVDYPHNDIYAINNRNRDNPMAIELVNIGTNPNDGEGDPLRTAFSKINNNFVWMQQTSTDISSTVTLDDTANQVIWEYPADEFTQALIQLQSFREGSNDSQNALIGASILNDLSDVKFTIYGLTNNGDWLTNYDMDVTDGNVRLLVSPLQNEAITHFLAYQVTWVGDLGVGVSMASESGEGLVTETGNVFITTEG